MANPHKGEVAFEVDDKRYVLQFDHNALVEIEDQTKQSTVQWSAQFRNPESLSVRFLRLCFHAGLRRHQPQMTVEDAGRLMTDLTGERALELLTEALQAAFPKPKEDGEDGAESDPMKAANAA